MSERKHRKTINKETEIYIQNNTNSQFFWENLHKTTLIKFDSQGDEELITFGELRTMVSQLRNYFANMRIIISEVMGDEFTILDIANALHLDKTYEDYFDKVADIDLESVDTNTRIEAEDFSDFVVDSDIEDYKKVFKTKIRDSIIGNTVAVYQENKTLDFDKMDVIEKAVRKNTDDDLWSDIRASQAG